MSVPETIYLQYVEGDDDTWSDTTWCDERINDDDIIYDRRRTCVWKWSGRAKAWFTGCHRVEQEKEATADWCRYCGGRVEITDGDAKEV